MNEKVEMEVTEEEDVRERIKQFGKNTRRVENNNNRKQRT